MNFKRRKTSGKKQPPQINEKRWNTQTETQSDAPINSKEKTQAQNAKDQPKKSEQVDKKYFHHQFPNSVKIRTITTIIMLVLFLIFFSAGHLYASLLVFFINVGIFRELILIKRRQERDRKIPLFYLISWYFFAVCIFFLYPRYIEDKLLKYSIKYKAIGFIMMHHTLISFLLYVAGILMFVLSLVKGQYRYQMGIFAWTHLALIFCILQSSMTIVNIYNGMIWFVLPCLCIIANDTFAYIFGRAFGRTPLIQLSPKKTWEGFIGGFLATLIVAYLISRYLAGIPFFSCPQPDIVFTPFQSLTCQINPVYIESTYELPQFMTKIGLSSVRVMPIQFHALIFTVFASFIAPFGGFFASGVKRAFRIKVGQTEIYLNIQDFGDSIPGHGGFTDRMDCQQMMATFVCIYTQSFIFRKKVTVVSILQQISQLNRQDQGEILAQLTQSILTGQT